MLVEQQDLGGAERRHDQRERLALAAGEQRDAIVQPLFKAELQDRQTIYCELAQLVGDGEAGNRAARCAREATAIFSMIDMSSQMPARGSWNMRASRLSADKPART